MRHHELMSNLFGVRCYVCDEAGPEFDKYVENHYELKQENIALKEENEYLSAKVNVLSLCSGQYGRKKTLFETWKELLLKTNGGDKMNIPKSCGACDYSALNVRKGWNCFHPKGCQASLTDDYLLFDNILDDCPLKKDAEPETKKKLFIKDLYQLALDTYGANAQVEMVYEEMAELQLALCKNSRGKDNVPEIADEIADVLIMLGQMMLLYDCEALVEARKEFKQERLMDRLSKKEGK